MKRYKAVLFDLFSTVAIWHADRMPVFEWRGKTSRSTVGVLRQTLEEHALEVPFAAFIDGLAAANEELAARRAAELKEFPSIARFTLALHKAGYPATEETRHLAQALSLKHMEVLSSVVDIPATHISFLARMAAVYPLALVSNFDHGPTARAILQRDEAARYFDPIVISDEHGWRKPHPSIFSDTLARLGVKAQDALYVGDSVADDIVGAKGAGLDIAWVNERDAALPDNSPAPDYVVTAIPDLAPLLLRA